MPSIPVYPPANASTNKRSKINTSLSYPTLLQTPSGLALLEIQGSLNSTLTPEYPSPTEAQSTDNAVPYVPVGKLVFPLYDPATNGEGDTAWQKRVYLYVGKHQRLTGEVKKLGKAVALLRRRTQRSATNSARQGSGKDSTSVDEDQDDVDGDALEIAEIVRWKIIFTHRPEPVGGGSGDADADAGADAGAIG